VHLRDTSRKNPRLSSVTQRNRSQSKQNSSNHGHGTATIHQGHPTINSRLAALNKFISRSAKRSLPFLKTLRSAKDFVWGPEQAAAFESLKQYLSDLATITSLDPALLLYIAAPHYVVSMALVQEKEKNGKAQQCPVYFVSDVLTSSKCNMTKLEKITYVVIMASRKLRHYFNIQSTSHFQ
jgi:hypothetical protein